jgi:hypothetical protein
MPFLVHELLEKSIMFFLQCQGAQKAYGLEREFIQDINERFTRE